MGMNIGSGAGDSDVISDINTTPLIDVMLVLLIMLIITIPIQLHAVTLNMPAGKPPPPQRPPQVVRLDVAADGRLSWDGETVAGDAALDARLRQVAAQADLPELHLRPDKAVDYGVVAHVLAAAQRAGVTRLGVVGSEQFVE